MTGATGRRAATSSPPRGQHVHSRRESPSRHYGAARPGSWAVSPRHTAITNDAAAGANPVALMTKAGHADMKTTRTYLHLAGVVFRDEAERLEQRLLAVESSTDLGEPQGTRPD